MTYAEEFRQTMTEMTMVGQEKGFFEVFGVQVTSKILGVALAIAGIGASGALWWFLVKPIQGEIDTLRADMQAKEAELAQKGGADVQAQIVQKEIERQNEERIATEIFNAYGQDKQMETFLLDLNRVLTASNVQLTTYEPTPPKPEFITDAAPYGEAAVNKLKYQTFNVSFANMTYGEAESMLRNLDLLQPLLVLRNFSTTTSEPARFRFENGRLVTLSAPRLNVAFVVDALIAPTPEELAQRQEELAAEAAPAEGEAPAEGAAPAEGG
jgi:type IV pilus assembly protein PilO